MGRQVADHQEDFREVVEAVVEAEAEEQGENNSSIFNYELRIRKPD
jgi:hypothetical protein